MNWIKVASGTWIATVEHLQVGDTVFGSAAIIQRRHGGDLLDLVVSATKDGEMYGRTADRTFRLEALDAAQQEAEVLVKAQGKGMKSWRSI
jgi:hypothetical protein